MFFLLFLLYKQLLNLFLFSFCSILHILRIIQLHVIEYFIHSPLPTWWILLLLLFCLVYLCPISLFHFFSYSHFSNFQYNFVPHSKVVWFYCSPSHTSHITNTRARSSVNPKAIYVVTYFVVRWYPVDVWMSVYHFPVVAKSLTSAKFTLIFPLWFISLWGLCPPHAGHK